MENKIVDGIQIRPTHDVVDYDNGNEMVHPELNKWHIADYDKALELLGYQGMQEIRVSATAMGLGTAMSCGKYIDIFHSPRVFQAIKEELIERRAILQEQLNNQ